MDFGAVLTYLKKRPFTKGFGAYRSPAYYRFRREGWDDSIQYVFLTAETKVPIDEWKGEIPPFNNGEFVLINPHIDMIWGDGSLVVGWMPDQKDMLAEDWIEVN